MSSELNQESFNGFRNKETFTVYHYLVMREDLLSGALHIVSISSIKNRNQAADRLKKLFTDARDLVLERQADGKTVMMILDIGSIWRVKWEEIVLALRKLN